MTYTYKSPLEGNRSTVLLAKYAYYNSRFALLAIQNFLSDFIEKVTSDMSF